MSSVITGRRIVTASKTDRSFAGEVFHRWDKQGASGWRFRGAWSEEDDRRVYTERRAAVRALRRDYASR